MSFVANSCFGTCCSEFKELEPVSVITESPLKSSSATPSAIDALQDPAFINCLHVCNLVAYSLSILSAFGWMLLECQFKFSFVIPVDHLVWFYYSFRGNDVLLRLDIPYSSVSERFALVAHQLDLWSLEYFNPGKVVY